MISKLLPFAAAQPPAGNGRTAADVTTYLANNAIVNVFDFMSSAQIADVVAGAGALDTSSVLDTAFAQAGAIVRLPAGTYYVNANLAQPVCAGIVGDGEGVTVIQCGPAVTTLLPLGSDCTYHKGYRVLGNNTPSSKGIVFGASESGAYRVDHVRVKGFSGAGSVGVHCQNALKSQFDKLTTERNSTNLLIDGTGGLGGSYPTTLEFNSLVCIDAGLGGGGGGQGVKIVTADGVVFNEPAFDSCLAEAVLVQPATGGTVVGVEFKNPRFEANNSGGSSTFQAVVDGTAVGCTARVVIRGGSWSAGSSTAKSLHLTGAGVAGYILDGPQVLNDAGTVVIDSGAYGEITHWPRNLPLSCVADSTGNGSWGTFTPTIVLGGGSVTYSLQTGSWTRHGRLVTVQIRIVIGTATSPSSSLQIGGLPAASSAGSKGAVSVYGSGLSASAAGAMVGQVDAGVNTLRLYRLNGSGGLVDPGADLQAGSAINVTATYEV